MTVADRVEAFETTTQKTLEWLRELEEEMELENRRRSYEILRAYFHALRDRLTVEEVAQLGAQLPMLLRGVYYEGWRPSHKPEKMNAREFLDHVAEEGLLVGMDETERAVRAATKVLWSHVSVGEVDDVIGSLPRDIRSLLL